MLVARTLKNIRVSKNDCNQITTAMMLKMITIRIFVVNRFIGQSLGNGYGSGAGPIWLDNVQCTGLETDIGNCWHSGWGTHNCDHSEDVSIGCYDSALTNVSGTIKLPCTIMKFRSVTAADVVTTLSQVLHYFKAPQKLRLIRFHTPMIQWLFCIFLDFSSFHPLKIASNIQDRQELVRFDSLIS